MNVNNDFASLILRLNLGILTLLHGLHKLIYGVGGIPAMLAANGLPTFLAYGVFIGEIIAPVMLIIGVRSRLAGSIIVINMLVALYLAHRTQFGSLNASGGWALELQAFFLITALAIAFMGGGKYSLDRK
jgi:putative oxidoreductase